MRTYRVRYTPGSCDLQLIWKPVQAVITINTIPPVPITNFLMFGDLWRNRVTQEDAFGKKKMDSKLILYRNTLCMELCSFFKESSHQWGFYSNCRMSTNVHNIKPFLDLTFTKWQIVELRTRKIRAIQQRSKARIEPWLWGMRYNDSNFINLLSVKTLFRSDYLVMFLFICRLSISWVAEAGKSNAVCDLWYVSHVIFFSGFLLIRI